MAEPETCTASQEDTGIEPLQREDSSSSRTPLEGYRIEILNAILDA
jgi:hypothetical protein